MRCTRLCLLLAGGGVPERLFHLDLARATAIGLVTTFHLWRFLGAQTAHVGPFDLLGPAAMGFTGVDLFFVVSGYAVSLTWCHTGRRQTVAAFWASRLLRIYPPYVVAIGVWCVVISFGYAVKPSGITDIATHLTFTHTFLSDTFFSVSGVFWSLAIEAHFYVAFPLLAMLGMRGLWGACAASLLFTIVVSLQAPAIHVLQWNLAAFLPLFLLGMALNRYPYRSPRAGFFALASALVVMILVPRYATVPAPELRIIERLIIGASLGFGIFNVAHTVAPRSLIGRIVTSVAVASYSIYLYNYVFFLLPKPSISPVLAFPLYFLFVFAAGVAMWALVERPSESMRRAVMAAIRRPSQSLAHTK
jgi:peptidoglycan/LPS O-acetylase OafA/YrhL